jgi:hypothetical protein
MSADQLDTMTIRATSPDGQIQLTFSGGSDITLTFRTGAYARYRERPLESQLARLATGVWTGYRRGYLQAIGETAGGDQPSTDERRRRFQDARARMLATAESPRGFVRVEAVGLMRWRVDIRDGALTRLTEQQFVTEANAAAKALLADYAAKMVHLKDTIFDLNLQNKDRWYGAYNS